ncbi:MAG: FkbM family methyltransferase [Actinomycetota bacterium]|nr:FkbM family methyltransferase [Actinomycetota bacterium]
MRNALSALPWKGRFTVPLPDEGYLQLASPGSHRLLSRLYWEGPRSYEPSSVKTWWCLSQDARVIADIGAYVGYYALLASKASPTATVHAFEPLIEAARLIRAFAEINGLGRRIRLHEVALGARAGQADFYLPAAPPNPLPTVGSTTKPSAKSGSSPETIFVRRTVKMTTLDSMIASKGRHLELIKIDVEGSEFDVLLGAQQTIDRSHPDIIIEVIIDGGETGDHLVWLREHGYRIFDMTPEGPVPLTERSLTHMKNARRSAEHRYGEVLASTKSDLEIATLSERIASLGWPGEPPGSFSR